MAGPRWTTGTVCIPVPSSFASLNSRARKTCLLLVVDVELEKIVRQAAIMHRMACVQPFAEEDQAILEHGFEYACRLSIVHCLNRSYWACMPGVISCPRH